MAFVIFWTLSILSVNLFGWWSLPFTVVTVVLLEIVYDEWRDSKNKQKMLW